MSTPMNFQNLTPQQQQMILQQQQQQMLLLQQQNMQYQQQQQIQQLQSIQPQFQQSQAKARQSTLGLPSRKPPVQSNVQIQQPIATPTQQQQQPVPQLTQQQQQQLLQQQQQYQFNNNNNNNNFRHSVVGNNNNLLNNRQSLGPPSGVFSGTNSVINNNINSNNMRNTMLPGNNPRFSTISNISTSTSNTMSGTKKIKESKKSILPSATTAATNINQGPQENRLVTDKNWQNQSLNKIQQFLSRSEKSYPRQINKNNISSESVDIMNFLCKMVDPHFKLPKDKPEEEIIAFFKRMGYKPSSFTKRAFSATNDHTKGYLYGALIWIIELIEYDQEVRSKEADIEKELMREEEISHKMFSNQVFKSYEAFLQDVEGDNRVDLFLENRYSIQNESIIKEKEESIERQNKYLMEIQRLKEYLSNDDIEKVNNDIEITRQDTIAANDEIQVNEDKKQELDDMIFEGENNHSLLERQLSDLKQRKKDNEARILIQQNNLVDARRINQERSELQEELDRANNDLARQDHIKQEIIRDIKSIISEIEKQIQSYQEICFKTQLVINNNNNNNNNNINNMIIENKYRIQFNFPSIDSDIQVSDLKQVIKNLKQLNNDIQSNSRSIKIDLQNNNNQLESLKESIKEKELEIARLKQKYERQKEQLENEKRNQIQKIQLREENIEKLDLLNKKNITDGKKDLENTFRLLEEHREEYKRLKYELEQSLSQLKLQYAKRMERFIEHRQFVGNQISETLRQMEELSITQKKLFPPTLLQQSQSQQLLQQSQQQFNQSINQPLQQSNLSNSVIGISGNNNNNNFDI